MPILFKPGRRTWGKTEHLRDSRVVDHEDALDWVWTMRDKSPGVSGWVKDATQWHKWGALDQETFNTMAAGQIGGKDFRLVGWMPPAVAALMHMYYPDILKDREAFYRLLKKHPEWRVPGGWKF